MPRVALDTSILCRWLCLAALGGSASACALFGAAPASTSSSSEDFLRPVGQAGRPLRLVGIRAVGPDAEHAGAIARAAEGQLAQLVAECDWRLVGDASDPEVVEVDVTLEVEFAYPDVAKLAVGASLRQGGKPLPPVALPPAQHPTRDWPRVVAERVVQAVARVPFEGRIAEKPEAASPPPAPPPADGPVPVVAVSPIAAAAGTLPAAQVRAASEVLARRFGERFGWRTAATEDALSDVRSAKEKSYEACFDEACQIELGKALAADKLLRASVVRLGAECVLSAALLDLRTETAERQASTAIACDGTGALGAIDALLGRLASGGKADP